MKEIPDDQTARADWKFQIVTTCVECHGSGKLLEGEGAGFAMGWGQFGS